MTVFSEAWNKRAARRDQINTNPNSAAIHTANNLTQAMDAAARATLGVQAQHTQSTFVLAYLRTKDAFLAFGIPTNKRAVLAQNLRLDGPDYITWVPASGDGNLHGEMTIIRWLKDNGVVTDKSLLGGDLTIVCTGKPVCADCCGFMTKYNIVHGVQCGGGSDQGWRHPYTGAAFRGETEADFTYQKSSKYRGSATLLTPNPTRQ
jgi:hypothetical protein